MRSSPWMLVAMTAAVALVAGVALALATDNWWLLPAALLVHLLGTVFVGGVVMKALGQQTKPGPTEEARRDEEGVGSGQQDQEEPKPVI